MTGRAPAACLLVCFSAVSAAAVGAELTVSWRDTVDRVWVGPDCWANRLQDWRVAGGRLECVATGQRLPLRTVHLLTHRLRREGDDFEMRVRLGAIGDGDVSRAAAAGFLLGAGGASMDHRAAAIVHHSGGPGAGIFAGIDGAGEVFFRDLEKRGPLRTGEGRARLPAAIALRLTARATGMSFAVRIEARDAETGAPIGEAVTEIRRPRLLGNVALVSHGGRGPAAARFWFDDWRVSGSKIDSDPSRACGPVLSTQYTLSDRTLTMTAQLMPLGEADPDTARLEIESGDDWRAVAEAPVIAPGWTATFRVDQWDASRDTPYRVVYAGRSWSGTVRRDPVDRETIVVAGFTGNHNNRRGVESGRYDWKTGMWFPHADLTHRVRAHDPDVLFFSGDQVYEGASPTRPDRAQIELDYLYKWYLWCWAYRDLARDRPTITIPDDHDVYQGNIWGEGGRKTDKDDKGGYVWPAEFVRMVERTQTSNLPSPFETTPIDQGIGVYYTDMTYGRISFAVLEDRKFKSGCNGRVPPSGSRRADHITDEDFDVRRADVPGLKLLGDRQLEFLADWAADWHGADMKVALSQTVFAGMATHHGANLAYLRADLDSNGWPQSGRARALRALRKGFAFHLCGDQHLATIVHHGLDDWEDSIWSFAVPSVANFYPRMWKPNTPGANREPGAPEFTGRHRDGLLNRVTVFAATNPGKRMGHEPTDLHDRMPGYGIVRLNKKDRTITMECWPRFADPANEEHRQYDGWPRTIHQRDNYARAPAAWLPTVKIRGVEDPVIHVVEDATGEYIYSLRIRGDTFRPPVFTRGPHTVLIGEPGTPGFRKIDAVEPAADDSGAVIEVHVGR